MGNIVVQRSHQLGQEELKKRVQQVEQKLKEKYQVAMEWQGDRAKVKGMGVNGTLELGSQEVSLTLEVGLMMRPFAGKIKEMMEYQIDKALA
jgi:putative polyhydroxyalkanoate system protein